MKITSQSENELVLTEGSASGMIAGGAMIAAAIGVGVFLRASLAPAPWIALALAVAGIAVILLSSAITVQADKTRGELRYQKKRLVGTQNTVYPLADIFRIETRKQWNVQNSGGDSNNPPRQEMVLVAQSVIVFKNGSELALAHQKTSSTTTVGNATLMGGQDNETAMAAQVAKFLGVPFEEIMPPNMSSGINITFNS